MNRVLLIYFAIRGSKMNEDTYHYLKSQPELINFVRYNPIWYRYLTRDPTKVYSLEKESKEFYGKTFSQRLDKVNNHIQMVQLLVKFSGIMKD